MWEQSKGGSCWHWTLLVDKHHSTPAPRLGILPLDLTMLKSLVSKAMKASGASFNASLIMKSWPAALPLPRALTMKDTSTAENSFSRKPAGSSSILPPDPDLGGWERALALYSWSMWTPGPPAGGIPFWIPGSSEELSSWAAGPTELSSRRNSSSITGGGWVGGSSLPEKIFLSCWKSRPISPEGHAWEYHFTDPAEEEYH